MIPINFLAVIPLSTAGKKRFSPPALNSLHSIIDRFQNFRIFPKRTMSFSPVFGNAMGDLYYDDAKKLFEHAGIQYDTGEEEYISSREQPYSLYLYPNSDSRKIVSVNASMYMYEEYPTEELEMLNSIVGLGDSGIKVGDTKEEVFSKLGIEQRMVRLKEMFWTIMFHTY